jgi:hypothetical protein
MAYTLSLEKKLFTNAANPPIPGRSLDTHKHTAIVMLRCPEMPMGNQIPIQNHIRIACRKRKHNPMDNATTITSGCMNINRRRSKTAVHIEDADWKVPDHASPDDVIGPRLDKKKKSKGDHALSRVHSPHPHPRAARWDCGKG